MSAVAGALPSVLAGAIVDTHALLQLVWVSLAAGVGVCIVYAIAVVGITKSSERRRAGQGGASIAFGALAVLALGVCAWAIATGVAIMTHK